MRPSSKPSAERAGSRRRGGHFQPRLKRFWLSGRTSADRSGPCSAFLSQLDQVAACILEHGGRYPAHRDWRLRKDYALGAKAFVLGVNIVNREGRERDTVFDQGSLERSYGGMAIGLEQEFGAIP